MEQCKQGLRDAFWLAKLLFITNFVYWSKPYNIDKNCVYTSIKGWRIQISLQLHSTYDDTIIECWKQITNSLGYNWSVNATENYTSIPSIEDTPNYILIFYPASRNESSRSDYNAGSVWTENQIFWSRLVGGSFLSVVAI